MGYFSNGTEGIIYQQKYCNNCWHDRDQTCAVWLAHLLHNGKSELNQIIPIDVESHNMECKMFIPLEQVNES